MIRNLDLLLIVRDPALQPRELLNQDTVLQYSEDMVAGILFPPVVVFYDRNCYWLSQGFHRCEAAEKSGWTEIEAEVREGTREDAILDAAASNQEFDRSGLRRSLADKRRAVTMTLEIHPEWTDSAIAKHTGAGRTTVWTIRGISPPADAPARRIRSNGSSYPAQLPPRQSPFASQSAQVPQSLDVNPEPVAPISEPVASSVIQTTEPDSPIVIETPKPVIHTAVQAPGPLILTPTQDADKKPPRPVFNATNDMVDWARWTWNPVTGCNHGCPFCYARVLAHRFYAEKFEPTFHPERLDAPLNTRLPGKASLETDPVSALSWKNVFVCSMADLFGGWVPQEWIDAVFDSCRQAPQWNYLFLTKYPLRYTGLNFPPTSWVGTSVVEQKWVANAEKAFSKIDAPVKWLSIEPMLERIVFNDLSMFDWVVIGSQSSQAGVPGFPSVPEFHPDPLWVCDLVAKAKDSGCQVYLKPNTFVGQGWQIKEYPPSVGGKLNFVTGTAP